MARDFFQVRPPSRSQRIQLCLAVPGLARLGVHLGLALFSVDRYFTAHDGAKMHVFCVGKAMAGKVSWWTSSPASCSPRRSEVRLFVGAGG